MTAALSAAPAAEPQGRRLYAWLGRHVLLVDGAVAGVCVALVVLFALLPGGSSTATPADAVVQVALFAPLAWRRVHPFPAACVMTVACLAQLVLDQRVGAGVLAVLLIIGSNAAHAPRWAARAVLIAALVGVALLALRLSDLSDLSGTRLSAIAILLVGGWALVGVSWLIGDVTRSRRLERAATEERSARVERERAQDRELAAAEERRAIARELHDVVAHSLAVVVTQADGARYAAAGTPGPAVPALEAIARTARGALNDMRGLLGVLRDGSAAGTAPAARLADLPALVGSVRQAGLDVRVRTAGVPRDVGQGRELVLHRVVQEALTNVLKHGGARATADVLLHWRDEAVEVEVLDTGTGPDPGSPGGHGLLGMRERLAVYGGDLDFGPRDGGGARLVARLPYEGGPDA